jgi:membrane-bound lytic murein transglycosylase D
VKAFHWGIAGFSWLLIAADSKAAANDPPPPSDDSPPAASSSTSPPAPAAAPSSQPPGAADPTDLYQIAKDAFEAGAPPEATAQYEFPDVAQFNEFAARLQAAIDGDSLPDLAAYEPQARAVLAVLRLAPDYANYADWLEARLQEIEAAGQIGEKTPPASAQPSAPPPPSLLSPPAPLSSGRNAELKIPYLDLWLRRVRHRPRPENAASLMPRLRAAFRAEGVSPDLAWLAEAESSLDPRASNPSGARGLFQLKAATAREMGLRTLLPDQRTDPDKSAHAAARYLRTLERHFGSWPLAIAAFNAGEGRVARELAARRATDYAGIASALPAGTRMYVPEVCALIEARTGTAPQDIPLPRG